MDKLDSRESKQFGGHHGGGRKSIAPDLLALMADYEALKQELEQCKVALGRVKEYIDQARRDKAYATQIPLGGDTVELIEAALKGKS